MRAKLQTCVVLAVLLQAFLGVDSLSPRRRLPYLPSSHRQHHDWQPVKENSDHRLHRIIKTRGGGVFDAVMTSTMTSPAANMVKVTARLCLMVIGVVLCVPSVMQMDKVDTPVAGSCAAFGSIASGLFVLADVAGSLSALGVGFFCQVLCFEPKAVPLPTRQVLLRPFSMAIKAVNRALRPFYPA